MKTFTKKESNAFLKQLQAKQDAKGKTIAFISPRTEEPISKANHPKSVAAVVARALNMESSMVMGKKHPKSQTLGFSRSLEDMYLLAKHYIPNVTIFDVVEVLKSMYANKQLLGNMCSTFRRMMFYKRGYHYATNDVELLSKYGII